MDVIRDTQGRDIRDVFVTIVDHNDQLSYTWHGNIVPRHILRPMTTDWRDHMVTLAELKSLDMEMFDFRLQAVLLFLEGKGPRYANIVHHFLALVHF